MEVFRLHGTLMALLCFVCKLLKNNCFVAIAILCLASRVFFSSRIELHDALLLFLRLHAFRILVIISGNRIHDLQTSHLILAPFIRRREFTHLLHLFVPSPSFYPVLSLLRPSVLSFLSSLALS